MQTPPELRNIRVVFGLLLGVFHDEFGLVALAGMLGF
jgi:hypothetical protein